MLYSKSKGFKANKLRVMIEKHEIAKITLSWAYHIYKLFLLGPMIAVSNRRPFSKI